MVLYTVWGQPSIRRRAKKLSTFLLVRGVTGLERFFMQALKTTNNVQYKPNDKWLRRIGLFLLIKQRLNFILQIPSTEVAFC